ncbi:MAG: hypothetical protein A2162_08500 [Deltaproteobacteria bacterium RBG_13_52_11b]|nr:MAG: hypothetical protein A2162_08500 [Deltaproteobacteria bacterium RBG_13_52_11b]
MHETCHAFVYTKAHSMHGVLTAASIKIPLLAAIFNLPEYVSREDRREILRNKWRDFIVKPEIPEALQADPVELPYRPLTAICRRVKPSDSKTCEGRGSDIRDFKGDYFDNTTKWPLRFLAQASSSCSRERGFSSP